MNNLSTTSGERISLHVYITMYNIQRRTLNILNQKYNKLKLVTFHLYFLINFVSIYISIEIFLKHILQFHLCWLFFGSHCRLTTTTTTTIIMIIIIIIILKILTIIMQFLCKFPCTISLVYCCDLITLKFRYPLFH